ncbi:unnamed protein product [Fusarium equiseti]|uniref:Rhodopsin domain-containing protein n=1 Tax=Fusarium equiseti TaxID=61235 RepID=A0A8J2IWU2_FUSEQ|nr:unnamed protein product [Fusarium equiseti]
MTGELIQAFANALPPMPPKDLGPVVQGFALAFGITSIVVVSLRIYVRAGLTEVSPRLLGLEGYLAVLATLILIPTIVSSVLTTRYGVGSHDVNIPSQLYLIRATEYQTYWEVLYFISSTIIKCAIGLTCIRLDSRKRVVYPIFVNVAVVITITILALLYVFANCRPFAATWNPALGTCQKNISLQVVSYIVSAFQMATDWACAIIPCFIVTGLQMSRRRRISVIAILGLGVSASVATCVRMPYLKYYDVAKYPNEIACIIACSLPPPRKLFRFYYGSSRDNYQITDESATPFDSSSHGIRLNHMTGRKEDFRASAQRGQTTVTGNDTDEDNSSARRIIRKTEVCTPCPV